MHDVIVVGGGPAGATAGRHAALMGLKTLVLEKTRFPRVKPCAGALSERARSYLDFALPHHLEEKEIFGGRLYLGDTILEGSKDFRLATMVTRCAFDEFLLAKAEEAGATIHMEERVFDFEEHSDYVTVRTSGGTLTARFMIIAEGAQGTLKYRVRTRDKQDEYGLCLVTEIEETNELIDRHLPGIIEIHFGVVPMGYGWVFPHDGYYSIGIGCFGHRIAHPRKVMEDFLQRTGFRGPCKIRGHLIPAGGIERHITGTRILLCGDAAGFVDPLTGEGIAYALRSGRFAVETIGGILGKDRKWNDLRSYETCCYREFGRNLRYALLSARIIHRCPAFFYRVLLQHADALDKYLETSVKEKQYLHYLRWLTPRIPRHIFP